MLQQLRAVAPSGRVDVPAKAIRGFVVAEAGAFTDGGGQFTAESLRLIVRLWPRDGLRCRFGHPPLFGDGLGLHLGRARNPRVDGAVVRADLQLNEVSHAAPAGDLGRYVLDLAASDPEALAASLALSHSEQQPAGYDEPPVWLPTRLFAVDLVDEGAATPGGLFGPAGGGLSRRPAGPDALAEIYRRRLEGQAVRFGSAVAPLRRRLEGRTRRVRPAAG